MESIAKSRTQNTIRNILFGIANKILALLLNFISRTVFIRVLGVDYLGINGLFADILMMLSLADLGFSTAMVYSFYRPLAENNTLKIAALTHFYKKVYNAVAFCVTGIAFMLMPFLKYIVNLDDAIPHLKIYYLLLVGNTVVSYLFVYKTSIINADQKSYLVTKYTMWTNCIKTVFQIFILVFMRNYFLYLLAQIVAVVINNLIASKKADELYPYIKSKDQVLSREEKSEIKGNMKSIFLYKFSSVLLNGTDNTLISILIGTVWVGIYSNYNMVIVSLNGFIDILYNSATASIGNMIVRENEGKRYQVFQAMQMVSLVITLFVVSCLGCLFEDLIRVWLGEGYILDNSILAAILVNFYLGGILHPIWSYREATGLYRKTKYVMVVCAGMNILLSVLFGRVFGMAGILAASAVSRVLTYVWYEPRLLFREYFGQKVYVYFQQVIRNAVLTVVVICGVSMMFRGSVVDTWPRLIFKTVVVGILVGGVDMLVYARTEGMKMICQRVRGLIRHP